MTPPLFTKRHYEWLARFAGNHLGKFSTTLLTNALAAESNTFDEREFTLAVEKARKSNVNLHASLDKS